MVGYLQPETPPIHSLTPLPHRTGGDNRNDRANMSRQKREIIHQLLLWAEETLLGDNWFNSLPITSKVVRWENKCKHLNNAPFYPVSNLNFTPSLPTSLSSKPPPPEAPWTAQWQGKWWLGSVCKSFSTLLPPPHTFPLLQTGPSI